MNKRINESSDPRTAFPVDPLLCDFALPLQETFYPLGFPVELTTNSTEVLEAANESWGRFPQIFSESPVRISFGVSQSAAKVTDVPSFRGRGHLVSIMSDPDNFATLDLQAGFGFSWISRDTIRRRPFFRYHFLEGAALTLLESLYLTSLHSACVELRGCGILLCGDAGAGKSSLSFACARRGWSFLSDDGSSIVRKSDDRTVIGNPFQIRFRSDAPRLFPELESLELVRGLDGEMAIELRTLKVPEIATAFKAHIEYIVFLNRDISGPARLLHYSPDAARAELERTVCFGDPSVREAQRASLKRMLSARVLELRYSDLDSAVRCMEELVPR